MDVEVIVIDGKARNVDKWRRQDRILIIFEKLNIFYKKNLIAIS